MRAPSANYSSLSNALNAQTSSKGAYFNAKDASRWNIRNQLQEKQFALTSKGFELKDKALALNEESLGLSRQNLGLQEKNLGIQEKALDIQDRSLALKGKAIGLNESLIDLKQSKNNINFIFGLASVGIQMAGALANSYANIKNAIKEQKDKDIIDAQKNGLLKANAIIEDMKTNPEKYSKPSDAENASLSIGGVDVNVPQEVVNYKESLLEANRDKIENLKDKDKQAFIDMIDQLTVDFWKATNSTIWESNRKDYLATMGEVLSQAGENAISASDNDIINVIINGHDYQVTKEQDAVISDLKNITPYEEESYYISASKTLRNGKAATFETNLPEAISSEARKYAYEGLDDVESLTKDIISGIQNYEYLSEEQKTELVSKYSPEYIQNALVTEKVQTLAQNGKFTEAANMILDARAMGLIDSDKQQDLDVKVLNIQKSNINEAKMRASEDVSSAADSIKQGNSYNIVYSETMQGKSSYLTSNADNKEGCEAYKDALSDGMLLAINTDVNTKIGSIENNSSLSERIGLLDKLNSNLLKEIDAFDGLDQKVSDALKSQVENIQGLRDGYASAFGTTATSTSMAQCETLKTRFDGGQIGSQDYVQGLKDIFNRTHSDMAKEMEKDIQTESSKKIISDGLTDFDNFYNNLMKNVFDTSNIEKDTAWKALEKKLEEDFPSKKISGELAENVMKMKLRVLADVQELAMKKPEDFSNEADRYEQMLKIYNKYSTGEYMDLLRGTSGLNTLVSTNMKESQQLLSKFANSGFFDSNGMTVDDTGTHYRFTESEDSSVGWKVDPDVKDSIFTGDSAAARYVQKDIQTYYLKGTDILNRASGLTVGKNGHSFIEYPLTDTINGETRYIYYDIDTKEVYNEDMEKMDKLKIYSDSGKRKKAPASFSSYADFGKAMSATMK